MKTPCAQLLPGHRHCEHGHTNDCPDPGECELLPEPRDLRVRAGVDPTLRAIRFGTDDEAREAYDRLTELVATLTTENSQLRPMAQRAHNVIADGQYGPTARRTARHILGLLEDSGA